LCPPGANRPVPTTKEEARRDQRRAYTDQNHCHDALQTALLDTVIAAL
jgi:hypothetical protein